MSFKKIILENFQSHAFTEINLHKGLNVITGESDRGKSAVIRALNWLIYNEPRGADFIRAGERECRVTVYLEDGGSVQRERTPSLNRYIVNEPGVGPQVYEGFGTRVPEEVSKALGVGQVMLDDNLEVSLNISKQLDPPFLISEPGSLKSKSIGRLYNVHIIDGAVRDTVRDINDLQREDRRLAREIEDMDKELQKYENLPSLVKRLEKTQSLIEHLDELRSKGGQLAVLAKRAQEIRDDTELQK
ncbi:MAG TPA: AAA family ATPase, partial [Clostridia bacterium]|nr:AAA family ATPase [Clostridia bacterium]